MILPPLLAKHILCREVSKSQAFQFCDIVWVASTLWWANRIQYHVFCGIAWVEDILCSAVHSGTLSQGDGESLCEEGPFDVPRAHYTWRRAVT